MEVRYGASPVVPGGATFIYREGAEREANVYPTLEGAVNAARRALPATVAVSATMGSPVGLAGEGYNFAGLALVGMPDEAAPEIVFQDGATITGWPYLLKNVVLTSESDDPLFVMSSSPLIFTMDDSATLKRTGTSPLITAGAQDGFISISLRYFSTIISAVGPVIDSDSNNGALVFADFATQIYADTFGGATSVDVADFTDGALDLGNAFIDPSQPNVGAFNIL